MKAFSVKNDRTYTPEYYTLIYDVFIANTLDEATLSAKKKLEAGNHFGDFELEEFGNNFHHLANDEVCGKLEPLRTCSYSMGGGGVVYKCLNCGEEFDDSQFECFTTTQPNNKIVAELLPSGSNDGHKQTE